MGTDRSRRRIVALRLSIFTALGLPVLACGGATRGGLDSGDPEDPAGGGRTSTPKPGGTTPGSAGRATGSGGGGIAMGGAGNVGTAGVYVGMGGATLLPPCTVLEVDELSGLVTCAEGYQERTKAVSCEMVGGAPGDLGVGGGGEEPGRADGTVSCANDPLICEQFELGYCNVDPSGMLSPVCLSGCTSHHDCGADAICLCTGDATGGRCVPSNCRTSSDCEPGYRCASYQNICGPGAFACQKAQDECLGSPQCQPGGTCLVSPATGYRVCEYADCGRPFLVEHMARVAPAVASAAWSSGEARSLQLAALTEPERAQLAAHWTKLGQMEHASIAAFARFSLQLLSLGAPPELIEASTRALADETAHARLCFEIASAYAGHAVGPGPLDIVGSLEVTSLADIVDLVIAEGCFGETRAALDALEAADAAADPVIRDTYMRIAQDEQRHAELAFRFVRWALVRDKLVTSQRLRAARSRPPLRDHATLQVALPCFDALLNTARVTTSTEELFTC